MVAAVFAAGARLGPWAKDEAGIHRPLLRRHGFWLLVFGAALYLPVLGVTSLWDPWESEYAEVARGILGRDDWISLWWVQEGWFLSKPVLNFWIQAISMAALGTHYHSDQMLLDPSGRPTLHPEWAVRAPNVLFALFAMYFLSKGVARGFGRRAGLIGALVLATVPDWYFIAHQTMADLPCVAPMTAAMGCLLLGIQMPKDQLARAYEVRVGKVAWRLTAWHLVFGAILMTALPQILYLFSRNLELVLGGSGPHGFRLHWDEFFSGSRGNCGAPGNAACVLTSPATLPKWVSPHPDGLGPLLGRFFGAFEPALQGLAWSTALGLALWLNWGERRVQRLAYIAAWYFASVATMGKGPEGVVLPAAAALAWMGSRKRWSELLRLEIATGIAVWVALVLPWFVAMYVRHGSVFTDRLIFHDMVNRTLGHMHDTNDVATTPALRFYVWQLGYAFFPWSGLVPLGLLYWIRQRGSGPAGANDAAIVLFMWFLLTFGCARDVHGDEVPLTTSSRPSRPSRCSWASSWTACSGRSARASPSHGMVGPHAHHDRVMLGAAAIAGAFLLALVGRDPPPASRRGAIKPGAIRFLQLFTYQYRRAWPDSLDFTTALTWLTVAGVVATALLARGAGDARRSISSGPSRSRGRPGGSTSTW